MIVQQDLPPGADWKAVCNALELLESYGISVVWSRETLKYHEGRRGWLLDAIDKANAGDVESARALLKDMMHGLQVSSPLEARELRDYVRKCLERILYLNEPPAKALNLQRATSKRGKDWNATRRAEDAYRFYAVLIDEGIKKPRAIAALVSRDYGGNATPAVRRQIQRDLKSGKAASERRKLHRNRAELIRRGVPLGMQLENEKALERAKQEAAKTPATWLGPIQKADT